MQQQQQQQQQQQPIWIDSSTKQLVKRVSEDASLLAAVLFNTPTVGCHHVQNHVIARAPKVIEEARLLGKRLHGEYEGLRKDVCFAADFAAAVCTARSSVQNIGRLSAMSLESYRLHKERVLAKRIAETAAILQQPTSAVNRNEDVVAPATTDARVVPLETQQPDKLEEEIIVATTTAAVDEVVVSCSAADVQKDVDGIVEDKPDNIGVEEPERSVEQATVATGVTAGVKDDAEVLAEPNHSEHTDGIAPVEDDGEVVSAAPVDDQATDAPQTHHDDHDELKPAVDPDDASSQ